MRLSLVSCRLRKTFGRFITSAAETDSARDGRDRLQSRPSTGVELFIGSKVLCMFCFENCIPEGKGGEKGGNVNFKIKRTEPLTQELP